MTDAGGPTRSTAGDVIEAARDGDPQRAVRLLRQQSWMQAWIPPPDAVLAVAQAVEADFLADAARNLTAAPDDGQAMFDYGTALRAVGLPDLAVPVFRAMLQQYPGNHQLLNELVRCLDDDTRHDESLHLLQQHREAIRGHFWLESLLVFEAVLAGELEAARASFATLPDAAEAEEAQRRDRLASMLQRADAAAAVSRLDDTDLRGWHFVITGGLLTGLVPFGLEDEMKGRSALLYDSYHNVHEGLRRARAVLERWGQAPARILGLPDHDSQVVATAAARLLGVELVPWQPGAAEPGLVVGYDLVALESEALQTLSAKRPGQALYVHAAKWTAPPVVAPDIVSVLHQHLVQPWGERMRMTMDEGDKPNVENVAEDTSAPDVLAEHVIAADPALAVFAQVDSVEQVVAYADPLRAVAAATRDTGLREPFWPGSPVLSNSFS